MAEYSDPRTFPLIFKPSERKGLTSESSFQPSGIAIHPVTSNIYIISSTGRVIIIVDRQGKIINLHYLDPAIFIQPEGICFSPSGELFISNEGKGESGNILKFAPAKPKTK